MEKEAADIVKKREKEMAKGGKAQGLAEAVNALEREMVKIRTQLEIKDGTLQDDAKRVEAAKKAVEEVSMTIVCALTPDQSVYRVQARFHIGASRSICWFQSCLRCWGCGAIQKRRTFANSFDWSLLLKR